jgi:hypothetical protein
MLDCSDDFYYMFHVCFGFVAYYSRDILMSSIWIVEAKNYSNFLQFQSDDEMSWTEANVG